MRVTRYFQLSWILLLLSPGCLRETPPGSCTQDRQCPSSMVCVYGCYTCYVECFGDKGTTCFGHCAPPAQELGTCYEDADCAAGFECTVTPEMDMTGHCVPAPCGGCPPPLECRDDVCACPAGELECDGACFCGACGTTCAEGWRCLDEVCQPVCYGPFVPCDEQCVDLHVDKYNCGACGEACDEGVPCVDGRCTPP